SRTKSATKNAPSASRRNSSSWRGRSTSPTTSVPPSRSASIPCWARPSSKKSPTSSTDMFTRRRALSFGVAAATAAALRPSRLLAAPAEFRSMTGDVKPVSRDEYLLRIDKARRLMAKHGIGALLIEPGASMVYFTGVHWWRSERLTAVVLPRDGDIAIVTPHFEAP